MIDIFECEIVHVQYNPQRIKMSSVQYGGTGGGSSQRQTIQLSAGEEICISGTGSISIELMSGVMEIAGMALEARKPYTFYLRQTEMPSFLCYTLEGGSMEVKSERPLELRRGPTSVAELHRFARRHFSPTDPLRVVVIGRPGVGKTHTASTLCNLLQRVRRERGTQRRTFLVDLNPASNLLFAPGCMSSREVTEKVPMWLGHGAHPACALPTLSFFCGTTARPSNAVESLVMAHFSEQCMESTAGWVEGEVLQGDGKEGSGATLAGIAGLYGLVVDTPCPQGGLLAVTYYKQLVQALQPTHVVVVTDELPSGSGSVLDDDEDDDDEEEEKDNKEDESHHRYRRETATAHPLEDGGERGHSSSTSFTPRWARILMEDLTRAMPGLSFIRIHPVTKPITPASHTSDGGVPKAISAVPSSSSSSLSVAAAGSRGITTTQNQERLLTMRLLQRYFIGGALYPMLACSKVVIPSSSVQFVELRYNPDIRGVTAYPTEPPHAGWTRLVCSLSHAEMLEEVPLAPTAGLLIITHVDEQADELAMLIPASGTDPLPRRFIVLPSFVSSSSSSPASSSSLPVMNLNDNNNNEEEEEEAKRGATSRQQRDEGLRITPAVLALVEESSVV